MVGYKILDGVLGVIYTSSEMDGEEGEDLDTQHLVGSAERGVTPFFVLPGHAIREQLTTGRVV